MEVPRKCKEIDPDYASHNNASIGTNHLTEEKLKEILTEEFNKELSQRENQIESIEKQIHKTRKLLHLIRYVLISSYYNRTDLEYRENEEVPSRADASYLFDQNRIHPALKKLLGKDSSAPNFSMCRSARRNKTERKANMMVENLNDSNEVNLSYTNIKTPNHISSNKAHNLSGFDRNRQKIKNRIIVGNISKWMPSYENDNLTHKWMMYVRGPKESPDVSHFIEKVVFYLHPSYKPHDVVEVSDPPFHLSRKGWGEFPVRVQIHFICSLNKPVDIVHNLKLDKTYSGRQTLGNESIIDLYLYDDQIIRNSTLEDFNEESLSCEMQSIGVRKHEIVDFTDICGKAELEETYLNASLQDSTPNLEHDYCTEDVKPDIKELTLEDVVENFEHSYSYPSTHIKAEAKVKPEDIKQEDNPLIYGLDESYSETKDDLLKKEPLYYRKSLVYTIKTPSTKTNKDSTSSRVKMSGVKRKSEQPLIKKLFTTKINAQYIPETIQNEENKSKKVHNCGDIEVLVSLPRNQLNVSKFKSLGEALPYLFKRLPLFSDLGTNPSYNNSYPFTASSLNEFLSWNIGKQSSAEFTRAKIIKNILDQEKIFGHSKWSTKTIMMYGRSHGYTPRYNFGLFEKNNAENRLIESCFESNELTLKSQIQLAEPSVDILNEIEPSDEKRLKATPIDISDSSHVLEYSYIRQEALECGIVLKNELLDENVIFNGAERMILESVKCLVDHLVRRSLHHAISEGNSNSQNSEINSIHVQKAMKDRKDLNALHQFRMQQTRKKYFFQ